MAERTTITVRLSPDARRGWDRICEREGVTLTALLEAVGCELLERGIVTEQERAVVDRARAIDQERRTRR